MVICCSYKKRVGKDTFFHIVKDLYPEKEVYRLAFADAVKEEVYCYFLEPLGIPKSVIDDPKYKESIRPLIQGWATLKRTFIDDYYWAKKVFEEIVRLLKANPGCVIIITDGKHLIEILHTIEMGGKTLHIQKDTDCVDEHSSEKELDDYHHLFNYTIENNGTEEEYCVKIKALMDQLFAEELN